MEEKGISCELVKLGEDKPDIMTKDFDIEIETGLKHDLKRLEEKLRYTKKIYVVVPNKIEKERYEKLINTEVMTIPFIFDSPYMKD